jgi:homoserine O-succinyltransferase/O-acetyltransferase
LAAIESSCGMIEIGLVYNLPISAFPATERRYMHLLEKAAGKIPFRLRFFSLSSTDPLPGAATCIRNIGADLRDFNSLNIDGLIVTGAEPRATALPRESYWEALTGLVDWAEANTHSTIWSCLAAHAAVLHLDGVERRRLAQKCSGMYDCSKVIDSWLTDGLSSSLKVSHSRLHDLSEGALRDRGYQVLTKSNDAGVDIFSKRLGSQFFFFQGHPEYDSLSLQREYLRDIGRYLAGDQEFYPNIPERYFSIATSSALGEFKACALAERNPSLIANLPKLTLMPSVTATSDTAATTIFRNWLRYLAQCKIGQSVQSEQQLVSVDGRQEVHRRNEADL